MPIYLSVCPKLARRIECNECGYPYCEARYGDDGSLPHLERLDATTIQSVHNGVTKQFPG